MNKSSNYYHSEIIHNVNSPNEIVPFLIEEFNCKSVLDVGCGTGTWLKVFNELGVSDIMGIDNYNNDFTKLNIPNQYYKAENLISGFELNRKYDLLLCLEVAEHLPDSSSKNLINCLTKHSDIIVFSAAIPNQGGQNHINEQYIDYWIKLFQEFDFKVVDIFRDRFWRNSNVDWWYKQNMFLFTNDSALLSRNIQKEILTYVHPELFQLRHAEFEALKKSTSSYWSIFKLLLNKVKRDMSFSDE